MEKLTQVMNDIKKDILRTIFKKKFIKRRKIYFLMTIFPMFLYSYLYDRPRLLKMR